MSAFAGEYTDVNKSGYHLANWWGLDELPFGEDSGVLYLKGSKIENNVQKDVDLTICFDKFSALDIYNGTIQRPGGENIILQNYTISHLWNATFTFVSSKNSLTFRCYSDSPVYYMYGNTGESWKEIPAEQTQFTSATLDDTMPDGYGFVERLAYYTVVNLVDIGFTLSSNSFAMSNQLQCANFTNDTDVFSFVTPTNDGSLYNISWNDVIPYIYRAYPTSECLRDWQLYAMENEQYEFLNNKVSILLGVADAQLGWLEFISMDVMENLPSINQTLMDIKHILVSLYSGPPFDDPTDDNTDFSDSVGSYFGKDNQIPDSGSNTVAQNFGSAFLFIRNQFDKLIDLTDTRYIIIFLLGMAFIAYTLGRVIKNKMRE